MTIQKWPSLVDMFFDQAATEKNKPFLFAKSDGKFIADSWSVVAQKVANLAASLKKMGVTFMFCLIQGSNHIVPITVCVRADRIRVSFSFRVCVARQIQPETGPTLSVTRGGQESVNRPLESTRTLIIQKVLDLPLAGRS